MAKGAEFVGHKDGEAKEEKELGTSGADVLNEGELLSNKQLS